LPDTALSGTVDHLDEKEARSWRGRWQSASIRTTSPALRLPLRTRYVSLPNALRLVCVYAAADDPKFDAAAVTFLGRLIAERRSNTLGSMQLVCVALGELRGERRQEALRTLLRVL